MLGWRDAELQHDVAELIDYLHPRLMSRSLGGSWQGRRQSVNGGLERTAITPLTQCFPIPEPIIPNFNNSSQTGMRKSTVKPWLKQDNGCSCGFLVSSTGGIASPKPDSNITLLPHCRCRFSVATTLLKYSGELTSMRPLFGIMDPCPLQAITTLWSPVTGDSSSFTMIIEQPAKLVQLSVPKQAETCTFLCLHVQPLFCLRLTPLQPFLCVI